MNSGDPEVEELSTSTCWTLLRTANVGRIALHGADDEIEIFPVNFIVDHGSIVFKTGAGTKRSLANNTDGARSRWTISTSTTERHGASGCAEYQS